jgi:hypothetical protein
MDDSPGGDCAEKRPENAGGRDTSRRINGNKYSIPAGFAKAVFPLRSRISAPERKNHAHGSAA